MSASAMTAGSSKLSAPDAAARAHSARVAEHLREAMAAAGGAIPFARFMELALYAPGLGYYSAGAVKLGAAGDFVTAPEISPLFGRCLARALAPVLSSLDDPVVLEPGAGSGALAAVMLDEWAALGVAPSRYLILETSAGLRRWQRANLAGRGAVEWIDTLPEGFEGVVVANEVLDAMPVTRFVCEGGTVHELGVAPDGEGFRWVRLPAPAALVQRVAAIESLLGAPLPDGYTSEVNFAAEAWVATVARHLARGCLLLVDYGFPRREFYQPQRSQGTLMCHYRHRAHGDPFCFPGLQDITAHVDFTAVAEAAAGAGLRLDGYTHQAGFLLDAGITALAARVNPADVHAQMETAAQLRRLTLPQEMGELFKVVSLSRGLETGPRGFGLRDLGGAL